MKELEKTYNPADIEDRLYQNGWTANISTQMQSAERGRERSPSPS